MAELSPARRRARQWLTDEADRIAGVPPGRPRQPATKAAAAKRADPAPQARDVRPQAAAKPKSAPVQPEPSLLSAGGPPFESPPLPAAERRKQIDLLDAGEVKGCTKCRLSQTRTQTVFGEGDAAARLMFIGEGPGENEDLSGRPFVGKAGQLLDKMIQAMGLTREQVFIANVVKCRPPGNRVPAPDEVATCTPYLVRQIELIRPEVIVTLGLPATRYVLDSKESMGRMRGVFKDYRGIAVMPTYHPAYVLRSYTRETREAVWSDLKKVMDRLGLAEPPGKTGTNR